MSYETVSSSRELRIYMFESKSRSRFHFQLRFPLDLQCHMGLYSLSHNPHPANLRWVRDGSPWPTYWMFAAEEIQQSHNIPSIMSSSPHVMSDYLPRRRVHSSRWIFLVQLGRISTFDRNDLNHAEAKPAVWDSISMLLESSIRSDGAPTCEAWTMKEDGQGRGHTEHDAKKTLIYFHIQVTTSQRRLLMIYHYKVKYTMRLKYTESVKSSLSIKDKLWTVTLMESLLIFQCCNYVSLKCFLYSLAVQSLIFNNASQ